uniref:Uncharacterized protein n=1 Tax=viral metagenome TaxID=1070528 RepID=A0A6M3LMP4_9ZZZZ
MPVTVEELVRDVLETHRGDWLTLSRINDVIHRVRQKPPHPDVIYKACLNVAAATSVQKRLTESIRAWQDDERPQWIVELRLGWD